MPTKRNYDSPKEAKAKSTLLANEIKRALLTGPKNLEYFKATMYTIPSSYLAQTIDSLVSSGEVSLTDAGELSLNN